MGYLNIETPLFIVLGLLIVFFGVSRYKAYSKTMKAAKEETFPVKRRMNSGLYYWSFIEKPDYIQELHLEYSKAFNQNISSRKAINEVLKEHERNNFKTLKLIKKCNELFKYHPESHTLSINSLQSNLLVKKPLQLKKVFVIRAPDFIFGLIGSITGVCFLIFVWEFVQAYGNASTGTPISGLYGAAEFNATLAWFGCGSIASGGDGMEGGVMAILLVVVTVTLCFMRLNTTYIERKEKQVKEMTSRLCLESARVNADIINLIEQLERKKDNYNQIQSIYQETYQVLFSVKWTRAEMMKRMGMFSKQVSNKQCLALDRLKDSINHVQRIEKS